MKLTAKSVNVRLRGSRGTVTRADRARAIRDAILPLIREHGDLRRSGGISTLEYRMGVWKFGLRTPFSNWSSLSDVTAKSYAEAVLLKQAPPPMPYGLDVWRDGGSKRMSVEWGADSFGLISFRPGQWDEDLLEQLLLPARPLQNTAVRA